MKDVPFVEPLSHPHVPEENLPQCRRRLSRIASGHCSRGGVPIFVSDHDDTGKSRLVLKQFDVCEEAAYRRFGAVGAAAGPVLEFLPRLEGVEDGDEGDGSGPFLKLTNLLYPFAAPRVLDVKIGVRTFLESECGSEEPRPDLYERMEALYPEELTEAERRARAVTKHRWMSVRDRVTTLGELGYRLDGFAGARPRSKLAFDTDLQGLRSRADTVRAFRRFAKFAATGDVGASSTSALGIARELEDHLRRFRAALEGSQALMAQNEFIGTSLLLVADTLGRAGVFWIDFAKTLPLPEGLKVTHRSPWIQGNREDGILTGVDNLVGAWSDAVSQLQSEAIASEGMGRAFSRALTISWSGPVCSRATDAALCSAAANFDCPEESARDRSATIDVDTLQVPCSAWSADCTFTSNLERASSMPSSKRSPTARCWGIASSFDQLRAYKSRWLRMRSDCSVRPMTA